ncbi:MAG TPA: hypothetical protein VFC63_23115 [Blastocatellia bacterium]|nr:hypothetical protein [Blastocatellia bacterium]
MRLICEENRIKLTAFCLIALSLAACASCTGKPSAAPNNSQPVVTVQKQGDKIITTTKYPNGTVSVIIAQPNPPDNLPKDIPNVAETTDSTYTFDPDAKHVTLGSYSPKAQKEVADYYEHELSSAGWSASMSTNPNKVISIKADKNGRQLEIDVLPYNNTGSHIMLKYNAST